MSIVEILKWLYKAIIGWPYIQDKHIAIDSDGPLARFLQNMNMAETPARANPQRNEFHHSVFAAW